MASTSGRAGGTVPHCELTRSPPVSGSVHGVSKTSNLGTVLRINSNRPFYGVPGHEEILEIRQLSTATQAALNNGGVNKKQKSTDNPAMLLRGYQEPETDRGHTKEDIARTATILGYTQGLEHPTYTISPDEELRKGGVNKTRLEHFKPRPYRETTNGCRVGRGADRVPGRRKCFWVRRRFLETQK